MLTFPRYSGRSGMRMAVFVSLLILPALCAAWETPVNIGDTINTSANEWYPVIAQDGSFMIFVSDRSGGLGASDLWISHWSGTAWDTPENMGSNVNTPWGESAPCLAENDTVLYFLSMDPSGLGGGDIWYSDLNGGLPGPKQNLGGPVNTASLECCPLPSHDGSLLYFCSFRVYGFGENDIWISEKNGSVWGTPYNAGGDVNTIGTDCPRWISDDDQTLVVCSTWPGGGYGNSDIYSTTVVGDSLGPLVNMGPELNSTWAEWGVGFGDNYGEIGGTIYFGSGRPGGYGNWDIWCSTSDPGALQQSTWCGIKQIPE
jgi:hypothetical protein